MLRIDTFASVLLLVLVAGAPACAQGGLLYGSDIFQNELGTIDRASGAWTLIGSEGLTTGSIAGLAYDPTANVIYGCNPVDHGVYAVDQATGQATFIGITGFATIKGMAYDTGSGTLYCSCASCNVLFTVNVATGAGTSVGSFTGGFGIEGLAHDPATGTLFALSDNSDQVMVVSKTTAALTALPTPLPIGTWRGLAWDLQTGVLLATRTSPGELFVIDPVTGAATLVGSTSGLVEGLAFKTVAPEYQVNQTGASLDIDGVQGSATTLATVNVAVGQTAIAHFGGANTGQPWDVVLGIAPPIAVSQGAAVIGGQILNIDFTDPTLIFLWNGFQGPPSATFAVPFSLPAPATLSLQMAVADPLSTIGIALSQPVRLIVQ